jgi:hypothetical protein
MSAAEPGHDAGSVSVGVYPATRRSRLRLQLLRRAKFLLRLLAIGFGFRALPFWIAGAWFLAAFVIQIRSAGLEPTTFATPDEAVNRVAALQINDHGSPTLALAFDDPEDLVHPRHWVSLGRQAIPGYAPVSIYGYALLLFLGRSGLVLLVALPASAAAVFALGAASLLPLRRRWLSVFAPGLGFPALYWLMRPWMNISALLIALCWGFFFWARWHQTRKRRWLVLSMVCVGAGAAVRPDYAAYLFSVTLLFSLASSLESWKLVSGLVAASGAVAILLNVILNKMTTGEFLRASYQIMAERAAAAEGAVSPVSTSSAAKLAHLCFQLILPLGLPSATDLAVFMTKYWSGLGLLPLLALTILAIGALLAKQARTPRWLYAAGVLLLVILTISRIEPTLFGSDEPRAAVHHSIPRYWSPVYLFAALPPLIYLGRVRRWFVLAPAALVLALLLGLGLNKICVTERASFLALSKTQRWMKTRVASLRGKIPADALVYTATFDKALTSAFSVATVAEPKATARSMSRALSAGKRVFAVEGGNLSLPETLGDALAEQHLSLVRLRARGVAAFRVKPAR